MACDHIVAQYGTAFLTLKEFPRYYAQYNKAVDDFNENYARKKGSKAIPPPIRLTCFPCCMGCGQKLNWEKIQNDIKQKGA